MSNDQIYRKELSNVVKYTRISIIGVLFLQVMGYVNSLIITRNVDAEFFGLFVLSMRIVRYLVLLSLFGFQTGSMKFISQFFAVSDHSRVKSVVYLTQKIVLGLSLGLSTIVFIFSPYISTHLFHKPGLSNVLRMMLVIVPFAAMSGVFIMSLRGLKLIKHQVLISKIIEPASRFVCLIIFFYLSNKTFGIVWTQIIIAIITTLLAGYFLYSKYLKFHKKTKLVSVRTELLRFTLPLYLNTFLNQTREMFPMYLMGVFLPAGEIGVYHIAVKVSTLIGISLLSLNMILGPTISSLYARNEKAILEKLLKIATKWIFTISLALFCIIIIYAEPLLSIFGTEYVKGKNILLILVSAHLYSVLAGSNGQIIIMSGRSKLAMFNSIISFVCVGILAYILVPKYGSVGAAISLGVNTVMQNSIRLIQLYYLEKIHPFRLSFFKPVVAGLVAFLITKYYESSFTSFIELSKVFAISTGVLIFLVSYSLILYLFRFDNEDRIIIETIKSKITS